MYLLRCSNTNPCWIVFRPSSWITKRSIMAEDERQLRALAESLLNESINSQRSLYSQQNITRTPDIILSEDIIAGAMLYGRMSNVRRFFCLFVTFDLLLTFLMWLICTMVNRLYYPSISGLISNQRKEILRVFVWSYEQKKFTCDNLHLREIYF